MDDVGKTALGVFIGAMGALLVHGFLVRAYERYEAQEAIKEINRQTNALQRELMKPMEALNRANAERMAMEHAKAERQEREREAAEEARLNALGKEETFKRRYVPPEACKRDPSTMDCANDYMRAKKAFDAAWGR